MNQIDNLISKSLYKPTDGFRFSNATGDNLTLQGKYALDGEIKAKIQSIKDKLVSDLATIATNLATDVKAKQDLIDGFQPKYDSAESSRAYAQANYDRYNAMPKGKEKEKGKNYWSGQVDTYTGQKNSIKSKIDKLNVDIGTLNTNAQTASDNLKSDAQSKLDDLTKQQNELAKSINSELSALQEKAKKDNDAKLQAQVDNLKPVDKIVSPDVQGKSTVNKALETVTKSKSKTLIYVGIGLVVIVGGFFLLKRRG